MALFAEAWAEVSKSGLKGGDASADFLKSMEKGAVDFAPMAPVLAKLFSDKSQAKLSVMMQMSGAEQERSKNARTRLVETFGKSGGEKGFATMWRNITGTIDALQPSVKLLSYYFDKIITRVSSFPLNMLNSVNATVKGISESLAISERSVGKTGLLLAGALALVTKIARKFAVITAGLVLIEDAFAILSGDKNVLTGADNLIEFLGIDPSGQAAKWASFGLAMAEVAAAFALFRVMRGKNPFGKITLPFSKKSSAKGVGGGVGGGRKFTTVPTTNKGGKGYYGSDGRNAANKVPSTTGRDLGGKAKGLFGRIGSGALSLGKGLLGRFPLIAGAFALFDSFTTTFEDKLSNLGAGKTFLGLDVESTAGKIVVNLTDFLYRLLDTILFGLISWTRDKVSSAFGNTLKNPFAKPSVVPEDGVEQIGRPYSSDEVIQLNTPSTPTEVLIESGAQNLSQNYQDKVGMKGGNHIENTISIEVNGANGDPELIAKAVEDRLTSFMNTALSSYA